MKRAIVIYILFLLTRVCVFAQVGINSDNTAPDESAMLDVKSSLKGLLLPRMTRIQRNSISTPAEGLMVYCTNCGANGTLSIFTNGSWVTFSHCITTSPVEGNHTMTQGQIIWNWFIVSGASGYKWNTISDYETATDMGTATSKTETGLVCDTIYTRYIWTYNNCGESDMTTLTANVPAAVPVAPVASSHVSTQTSIVWNWNIVPDATGYKWNVTNDYATATEMSSSTTKTETGISCGTAYTRYVWAYNGCGYSSVTLLNQSTDTCVVLLPTVTTTTPTDIAQTTATSGGNVTGDGNGIITERGVCWSLSPDPTTADFKTIDGSGTGIFTSSMTGLSSNTLYYVKAYAVNSAGTAYGDQMSFTTLSFEIGQSYGGGTIFYIDGSGIHGLISATTNQSTGAQWGCAATTIPGTSILIGTGQANTTAIVNGCITAGIAARICNDLSLNGYDDWYLPSKNELNLMYTQKIVIGGFTSNNYWSSSENDSNFSWAQSFGVGTQNSSYKGNLNYVRAIRSF